MTEQEVLPRVRDFFRGKSVLVTGGSGFLGRTLIEKLLWEAPDISKIFVVLRPKKGRSPQERLEPMTNVKLFERLRRAQPDALGKIQALAGDVQEPNLGLSAEDVALLQREVHVVFNVAASVRFDDTLRKAVLINVRGTREACELAKGMRNLQAFMHVSTAYCNSDRDLSEEILYPPVGDWRTYIEAAETVPDVILSTITRKLLGLYPNTYVFTKALAEQLISDYSHEFPVAILRPSVVLGTYRDPFPGWLDNTYGPVGATLAGMVGVAHINSMNGNRVDCIPADLIVNALIIMSMKCAKEGKGTLSIVNGSSYDCKDQLFQPNAITGYARHFLLDHPIDVLYKAYGFNVENVILQNILFNVIDLPQATFFHIIIRLSGHKKGIMFIYRILSLSMLRLRPFGKDLQFPNHNFLQLNKYVSPDDKSSFEVNVEEINMYPYHFAMGHQLKKYFFKPKKYYPMTVYMIQEIVHYIACGLLLWAIWKMKIASYAFQFLLRVARFILLL